MCTPAVHPQSPTSIAADRTGDSSIEVSVPGALQLALTARKSNQKHEKKTVSFHPRVEICDVENHEDYTDNEHASCWYLQAEIDEMRQHVKETVLRMRTKSADIDGDVDMICTRGLEHHGTRHGSRKAKLERRRVVKTVLLEQEINKGTHFVQEKLAIASLRASVSSRKRAVLLGAEDAAYAMTADDKNVYTSTSCCITSVLMDAELLGIDSISFVPLHVRVREGSIQVPSSLTNCKA